MKLPNAEHARVDREKVTAYLLSMHHPRGTAKARFFESFGFQAANWTVLADALHRHAVRHMVTQTVESAYGTLYAVEGELESPDGRNPRVRTIWIIESGIEEPRLITAHAIEV